MKSPAIAIQLFPALAGSSAARRLITYGEAADAIGQDFPLSIKQALGLLGWWCQSKGWPTINTIVVNQTTGEPGEGVIKNDGSISFNQWQVFNHPWFAGAQPTLAELEAIGAAHSAQAA